MQRCYLKSNARNENAQQKQETEKAQPGEQRSCREGTWALWDELTEPLNT
jgi:hypothetical protein